MSKLLTLGLYEAYIPNLGLLLCLEPSKKFRVGVAQQQVQVDTTPNLVFCFGPKLWFWPRPKLNKKPTAGKL